MHSYTKHYSKYFFLIFDFYQTKPKNVFLESYLNKMFADRAKKGYRPVCAKWQCYILSNMANGDISDFELCTPDNVFFYY